MGAREHRYYARGKPRRSRAERAASEREPAPDAAAPRAARGAVARAEPGEGRDARASAREQLASERARFALRPASRRAASASCATPTKLRLCPHGHVARGAQPPARRTSARSAGRSAAGPAAARRSPTHPFPGRLAVAGRLPVLCLARARAARRPRAGPRDLAPVCRSRHAVAPSVSSEATTARGGRPNGTVTAVVTA